MSQIINNLNINPLFCWLLDINIEFDVIPQIKPVSLMNKYPKMLLIDRVSVPEIGSLNLCSRMIALQENQNKGSFPM